MIFLVHSMGLVYGIAGSVRYLHTNIRAIYQNVSNILDNIFIFSVIMFYMKKFLEWLGWLHEN